MTGGWGVAPPLPAPGVPADGTTGSRRRDADAAATSSTTAKRQGDQAVFRLERRTLRLLAPALAGAALVAAAALFGVIAMGGESGGSLPVTPEAEQTGTQCCDRAPTRPTGIPQLPSTIATSTPPPSVERIQAAAANIDAPVIEMGLDGDRRMEIPGEPLVVAWYNFSAPPGMPGNAVFAGHLSWHDGSRAAFEDLAQLAPGDAISIHLADGSSIDYVVAWTDLVEPVGAGAAAAIAGTSSEMVTLITCAGSYDQHEGQYELRLVVRAERIS